MIAILTTSQKQFKNLYLIVFGKIKIYNFSKNGHILHNRNNVVKDLMNAILNSH
jgi:hypothetical protein